MVVRDRELRRQCQARDPLYYTVHFVDGLCEDARLSLILLVLSHCCMKRWPNMKWREFCKPNADYLVKSLPKGPLLLAPSLPRGLTKLLR